MLKEMADWIAIHGEAIYSTRPWQVYGEGPVRTKGGHFKNVHGAGGVGKGLRCVSKPRIGCRDSRSQFFARQEPPDDAGG